MKILFVTLGTERVAASRYRVYQYLPYLESQGIGCRVVSIVSDFATGLAIRSPEFGSVKRFLYYIYAFSERFFRFWMVFFAAGRCDLVFLQRATFPFGLARLLPFANKKIVFDIDDAIFLPDTSSDDIVTKLKGMIKERELSDVLKISRCVIVENDYIKGHVSKYCRNVYKIPGPIDTERYFVKSKGPKGPSDDIVIGWIGSPATTSYLRLLDNVFEEILSRFSNARIVLIGAGNYAFSGARVTKIPWSYGTEVGELQKFDIGIMPMPDDEWTRGKLGCKMLQYMAVGVPAVVSYTPTNAELIRSNENGFLVKSDAEWVGVIERLFGDEGLRRAIGSAGRSAVEKACSVKVNGPKMLELLRSI